MKINCIIVDDEPIARDILKSYTELVPELNLLKSCISAAEAYECLYQHQVDLVFLDIQMPVITGMEFLRSLRNPPLIIFTTAYSNYAVEGFELNSVDYLLKPVTFERFYQAIQKVTERMALRMATVTKENPDYIFIKQDSKLVRVNHDQIDYIRAERDFCSIYIGEKRMLASLHMKLLEDLLPGTFLRVHRSFIVNLKKVQAIKGNTIELGKEEVPIGANYRDALMIKLKL
jgi:DNA-binding LytR/AlgR family response regulator